MIEKININGVEYAVTPVTEGEAANGVTVKVDGVTYLLGDPIVAPAAPAASSGSQAIEKVQVNGAVYDIADVEGVEAEIARATEAEEILRRAINTNATNLAETKKDIANQLFAASTADKVSITGRNEQSMHINFSANIPAATTEKAGVMTAEDKKALDGNVNSSSYSVVDAFGNIILKIDKDGLRTTEVTTSQGKLGELLDALAAAVEVAKREFGAEVNALKSAAVQASREIAGKIDSKADSDSFVVADAAGNIIFKVDKEGAHAPNLNVVTPTWVIAQVLGEVYIPINIVRDSAGDVVSCDVLFGDGIAGTIVLERENGEVSHIVATHGGVNAEAEIIREDGNVKQINIL